jgi:hypothetical protein
VAGEAGGRCDVTGRRGRGGLTCGASLLRPGTPTRSKACKTRIRRDQGILESWKLLNYSVTRLLQLISAVCYRVSRESQVNIVNIVNIVNVPSLGEPCLRVAAFACFPFLPSPVIGTHPAVQSELNLWGGCSFMFQSVVFTADTTGLPSRAH